MDAATWVALLLGVGSLGFSLITYNRNRIDLRDREEREHGREEATLQRERQNTVADRWLRERQAAYADALAAAYAWFDALSEEARHAPAADSTELKLEIDRGPSDAAFKRLVAAQGVLNLLAPAGIRLAMKTVIEKTTHFGWGVRDLDRREIEDQRPLALRAIEGTEQAMREDLFIDAPSSTAP